jgi:ribosomal protein S18 acetylase RimI-like enzyme
MNNIIIRLATESDTPRIWEIRNHPLARINSLDQKVIPFGNHVTWFKTKYFDQKQNFCFVMDYESLVIGYCRFDLDENKSYRVSIAIDPNFFGQGFGSLLLNDSLKIIGKDAKFLAEIKKNNESSIKIFSKCGFVIKFEDVENYYYEK